MTRWRVVLALAVVALAANACGRKAPPVAPELRLPQPVADLSATVRIDAIELAWSNPQRRVDHTRVRDLATAHVFRIEDDGSGEPKPALLARNRVAGYTEIATIPVSDPPSALVTGGRVVYPDRHGLTVGRRYTYVVLTTDAAGRTSPPSPRLTVRFLASPEAPHDVRAEPGDTSVRVAWAPPQRLSDDSPVEAPLVYEVLRGTTADALVPVARTAPGTTSHVDANLANDLTYYFAVRAVREAHGTRNEGPASSVVSATPVDTSPPAPPETLVAIPSQGTVQLSWGASGDADVAGYVVYRAAPGTTLARVGSVRAPATTFTDREVPRGTWRYVVTAQDGGSRANESAPSNAATVSVP